MRKFFYFVLIVAATSIAYAETIRSTISKPDGTTTYIYTEGKVTAGQDRAKEDNTAEAIGNVTDGIVKVYYDNGMLKSELGYKNGALEGMSRTYYPGGELMYEYSYKEGKLDGTTRKYYRNGKVAYEWNYRDNKREGITKSYDKRGVLQAEWNFKEDRLDGTTRIYYKDGGIKYIDTYRDGIKINRKSYDKKGKLEFDQDYPAGGMGKLSN